MKSTDVPLKGYTSIRNNSQQLINSKPPGYCSENLNSIQTQVPHSSTRSDHFNSGLHQISSLCFALQFQHFVPHLPSCSPQEEPGPSFLYAASSQSSSQLEAPRGSVDTDESSKRGSGLLTFLEGSILM